MKIHFLTSLFIAVFTLTSCQKSEPEHRWMKGNEFERLDKVAEHLRGNDVVMWQTAYRHKQLYLAITSNNQEFAQYQLEKIMLTMRHGSERRPKRKSSYDWFITNAYPPMKAALDSDADNLTAYKAFTENCITCHTMEKVPFMPVAKLWEGN